MTEEDKELLQKHAGRVLPVLLIFPYLLLVLGCCRLLWMFIEMMGFHDATNAAICFAAFFGTCFLTVSSIVED